ncbi:MAG: hypothetical protein GY909_10715 [Oligoflexia bacterium]|nr:hypothetical protein [Oligoflexia bacterium]
MSLLVICLFALISHNVQASSASDRKPFKVTIEGDSNKIKIFQARAEYKMAKSIQFCRGFYIPTPVKKWSCKKSGNRKTRCTTDYQCKMIKKSFSRVTETKKAKRKLSKLPRIRKSFKMKIAKLPYTKRGLGKSAKIQKNYAPKKKVSRAGLKSSLRKVKKQVKDFDEFEALEREIEFKKRKAELLRRRSQERKQKMREEIKPDEEDLVAAKEAFADDEIAELDDEMKSEDISKQAKEAIDSVEDSDSDSSRSSSGNKKLNWKIVTTSLVKTADDFENSVTSFEVGWEPRYSMTENWSFRGNLSFHSIKVATIAGEESFSVIDYGFFVDYRFWETIYAEVGIGQQKWNTDTEGLSGSNGTFGIGIGYQPQDKWLGYIDRIFYRYSTVGNEANNKEGRFGLVFSF